MHGEVESVIPGNALIVDPNKPFRKLNPFGNTFLNRWVHGFYSQCVVQWLLFRESNRYRELQRGRGRRGRRDNSRVFFSSLEFLVLVPNFRAGRHLPYLRKNGERKRYHPRGWWKPMYSDRNCKVRTFKDKGQRASQPLGGEDKNKRSRMCEALGTCWRNLNRSSVLWNVHAASCLLMFFHWCKPSVNSW